MAVDGWVGLAGVCQNVFTADSPLMFTVSEA
jgi:hypothetical protein